MDTKYPSRSASRNVSSVDFNSAACRLNVTDSQVVNKMRGIIRSFTPEELELLKSGKATRTVHLCGTIKQRQEDIKYFEQMAIDEGIEIQRSEDTVKLGTVAGREE